MKRRRATLVGLLLLATAAVAWHGGGRAPVGLWLKYGPPLEPGCGRTVFVEGVVLWELPRGYGRSPPSPAPAPLITERLWSVAVGAPLYPNPTTGGWEVRPAGPAWVGRPSGEYMPGATRQVVRFGGEGDQVPWHLAVADLGWARRWAPGVGGGRSIKTTGPPFWVVTVPAERIDEFVQEFGAVDRRFGGPATGR